MSRFREVKMYGDTWVIKLNPSDAKDFHLKKKQEVDVEKCLKTTRRKYK